MKTKQIEHSKQLQAFTNLKTNPLCWSVLFCHVYQKLSKNWKKNIRKAIASLSAFHSLWWEQDEKSFSGLFETKKIFGKME